MSTILDTIAQAIADVASTTVTFTASGSSHTSTITAYRWAPKDLDLPCAVVEMPTIARVAPEAAESQLGSDDWLIEFPVVFYFELDDPVFAQEQAVNTVEAFIQAIDADGNLGMATVIDTKVIESGPPELIVDQQRAQIAYPTRVQLLKLV